VTHIIQTERLTLTPLSLADMDDLLTLWRDENFTRFTSGRILTEEEIWIRLLRDIGHWSAMGFGNWAIRLSETGQHVGSVGLFDYRRSLEPPFDAPEVGWGLRSDFHGKGLAAEALTAALAWSDQNIAKVRTVCMISPQNQPSIRLALRSGFRPYAQGEYSGSVVDLYERPRFARMGG